MGQAFKGSGKFKVRFPNQDSRIKIPESRFPESQKQASAEFKHNAILQIPGISMNAEGLTYNSRVVASIQFRLRRNHSATMKKVAMFIP